MKKHLPIQILTLLLLLAGPISAQETPSSASPQAPMPAPSETAPAEAEVTLKPETSTESAKPRPRLGAGLRKTPGDKGGNGPRNGLYLAGFGGINLGDNTGIGTESSIAGATNTFEMESSADLSFLGGFKVGYNHYSKDKDFDDFQLVPSVELEFAYNNTRMDAEGEGGAGAGSDLELDMDIMTIMANAYLRFHNRVVVPYIGFGGGLGHITLNSASGSIGTEQVSTLIKDDQYVPVFQGIVGAEREIFTPNWTVFGEYRALFLPDASFETELTGAAGNEATFDLDNLLLHQFALGLRYHF